MRWTAVWLVLALTACDGVTKVVDDLTGPDGATHTSPESPAAHEVPTAPPAAAKPLDTVKARGQRLRAVDGAEQVLVPAGTFRMGRDDGPAHEMPLRVVTISRDFWIDRTEVTVAQWQACVDAGTCNAALASDTGERGACNWKSKRDTDHPMNCVGSPGAQAYCAWTGGALPTEAQWEYAARGEESRIWPSGTEPKCVDLVWSGPGTCVSHYTEPVATRPRDVSVFAVHDMGGNVREWTRDFYAPDAYGRLPAKDPVQRAVTRYRVSRGGAYLDRNTNNLRASFRHRTFSDVRQPHNGFRCVGGKID